jgi:BASS family bile acid:Na+ symporter
VKDFVTAVIEWVTPTAVALVMLAQALKVSAGDVAAYFKDHPWLIARSLLATLVLAPAAVLGVLLVMKPAPGVAVGLAILASCPPAPMMLKATPNLGEGRAAFIACLHVTLAALAFFTVPFVLEALSQPLGFEAEVDLAKMAVILGRTILGPVALGLCVRAASVKFADAAWPKLDKVGGIGVALVLVCLLIAAVPWLAAMDAWSYLVIVVVAALGLAIGHFAGTRDPRERTALAIESGVRHPGLAITIGAENFSPQRALPVLVPCVLVCAVVATAYLLFRRRAVRANSAGAADLPASR